MDKGDIHNFSGRVIQACIEARINIDDLVSEEIIRYWREDKNEGRKNIPFVQTRNALIHDHFDVASGESHRLIDERRTARALAERLLLAKLGVNPRDTPLGDHGYP